jgi:hypothetical protein
LPKRAVGGGLSFFYLTKKIFILQRKQGKTSFYGGSMAEKLTEIFNLRISPSLKQMVDQISNDEKKELNKRIRVEIARAVHNHKFNPDVYLEDEQ